MNNEPMPIKDLGKYLKSLKENNSVGDGSIVDMGQIITPRKTPWTRVLSYATAICLFIAAGGLITYNLTADKNITIVINSKIDSQEIKDIISSNGAEVISVKQNEDNNYEIKINLKKNINSFLEKLRNNKEFNHVEIEE